jgi:hypothetical protein
MKKPKFQPLVNLYRRLFARNREHVGIRTSYNLYRMHPILRALSKGRFMEDENPRFPEWLDDLRAKGYTKVLLLGNAPCLNDLTPEMFEAFRREGWLTIGLNRSIYVFQTDILLWTDLLTIDDILKKRAVRSDHVTVLHTRLERDHRLPAAKDKGFHRLHKYWSKHRNFRDWPKRKLFMFRNCAVAALHLCHRIGAKEVLMVGFGFDSRDYFYKTDKYKKAEGYEIISAEKLDKNCGGYDTQKIVREVIDHLLADEGFSISYNGDSGFLASIDGMKRVTLAEFDPAAPAAPTTVNAAS